MQVTVAVDPTVKSREISTELPSHAFFVTGPTGPASRFPEYLPLESVTWQVTIFPSSPGVRTYVSTLAPSIALPSAYHWYLALASDGSPVADVVSVDVTVASPSILAVPVSGRPATGPNASDAARAMDQYGLSQSATARSHLPASAPVVEYVSPAAPLTVVQGPSFEAAVCQDHLTSVLPGVGSPPIDAVTTSPVSVPPVTVTPTVAEAFPTRTGALSSSPAYAPLASVATQLTSWPTSSGWSW